MKRKKDSYTLPFPRDANEDGRGKEEYVLWFDHNTRNWPFIIWGLEVLVHFHFPAYNRHLHRLYHGISSITSPPPLPPP